MDCIVTAGGLPGPEDSLYPYTQGKPKALLDMGERTMLERVMDALQTSNHVDRIVLVGLEDDMGMNFKRPIDQYLPDHGSLVGNVLAGIEWLRQDEPNIESVLFCTSDLPALTGANVDSFIERCEPFDKGIYYIFVTRETMEARFPDSKRTYVKLKGVEVAGGDIAIAQADLADTHEELWRALTNARKHAWKLARVIGFRLLLKFLFRQLSINDIEETAARIIDRPAEIVLDAPAEMAMDVDRPRQLELLRADLQRKHDDAQQ
ncbi:MAG: nucleotidyltransferase family protein [Anaerolineaceae bacterium]|nr:MAG: nucleotidyltransferase family protein [Anaerolineaceae bacterium]